MGIQSNYVILSYNKLFLIKIYMMSTFVIYIFIKIEVFKVIFIM